MPRIRIILIVCVLLIPVSIHSQGERYQHPLYEISFEATPNWTEHLAEANEERYSLVNPNHNMVISLGYVPDCKRPLKYMKKLSGFKGLVCLREGYDTVLNGQDALVFYGNCLEIRESFSTMVIGFPTKEGLFLMEISCPENCQAFHRQKLQTILNSVRIGKVSII